MYLDNKIITLNSLYATRLNDNFNSNVVFNFNNILSEDETFTRAYISVMNAQFPNSFYTITSNNNTCYYRYGVIDDNFNVPVGNYNATTLIAELTSYFTGVGRPFTTIIIDTDTGLLTFTAPTNFSFYLCPFNAILGFFRETTLVSFTAPNTISSVGNALTAPFPLNLLGIKQLLVKSSQLAISSFDSKSSGIGDTLACIVNGVASYGLIQYEMTNELNKNLLINPNVSQIDIRITDENDNLINFNNINWTMALCLTVERKEQPERDTPNLIPYVKSLEEPKAEAKAEAKADAKEDPVDAELKLLQS